LGVEKVKPDPLNLLVNTDVGSNLDRIQTMPDPLVGVVFCLERKKAMKHCLTIAGSDASGGAGIQADIKTFSALGAYAMSAIVSVVAENTSRVISVFDLPPSSIADQIDAVFEDITVDAVKVGMLSNAAAMETVAGRLQAYTPPNVVVDPVMVAKGGCALMQPEALSVLRERVLPCARIVTPNIPEAEAISGIPIRTPKDIREAARCIADLGAQAVLIKGGHLPGDPVDVLLEGGSFTEYPGKRIPTKNTHGTGCTLSSAIAAFLAQGLDAPEAVRAAKQYVTQAIAHALDIGKGHGPTHHFFDYYQMKGIL